MGRYGLTHILIIKLLGKEWVVLIRLLLYIKTQNLLEY